MPFRLLRNNLRKTIIDDFRRDWLRYGSDVQLNIKRQSAFHLASELNSLVWQRLLGAFRYYVAADIIASGNSLLVHSYSRGSFETPEFAISFTLAMSFSIRRTSTNH